MDQAVESEIYNDIGIAVVDQIGTQDTKILLYLEMTADGLDYSIRYLDNEKSELRSLPAGGAVATSLFKLQVHVENLPSNKRWTIMEYWLDYGEINISLSYDEIDEEVPHYERAPAVIAKYFPEVS